MSHTILTNRGRYFSFDAPEDHDFPIGEIAHALSNICRFTGHVREFYSVAQHSVLVSQIVPYNLAMAGLMHDAVEAYVGDVASPLKRMLPEYKAIENRVEAALMKAHGLPFPLPPEIKMADMRALITEKRDLMGGDKEYQEEAAGVRWPDFEPMTQRVVPMDPWSAYDLFMSRWLELKYNMNYSRPY